MTFYHVTDLPDGTTTTGQWDLRGNVDAYLGGVDFAGKRVLEIGPASGFLTMEMERRGADVVALDIPEDGNWDIVPFPKDAIPGVCEDRISHNAFVRSTFRFTHETFNLKARAVYADAYNIPDDLGTFDIAVLAAVLLHVRRPHDMIEECAKRASTIIVTDLAYPELEHAGAVIRLRPTWENRQWHTWWDLTSGFVGQFLRVLGFHEQRVTFHTQRHTRDGVDIPYGFFTVVATRSPAA